MVNAYAYDQSGNKGVAFGLLGLQFAGDDDAFGGGVATADDFAVVEDADAAGTVDSAVDMLA